MIVARAGRGNAEGPNWPYPNIMLDSHFIRMSLVLANWGCIFVVTVHIGHLSFISHALKYTCECKGFIPCWSRRGWGGYSPVLLRGPCPVWCHSFVSSDNDLSLKLNPGLCWKNRNKAMRNWRSISNNSPGDFIFLTTTPQGNNFHQLILCLNCFASSLSLLLLDSGGWRGWGWRRGRTCGNAQGRGQQDWLTDTLVAAAPQTAPLTQTDLQSFRIFRTPHILKWTYGMIPVISES